MASELDETADLGAPKSATTIERWAVPRSGALLAGNYRIGRRLGAGATGTVVLAQDEALDRTVAVKFLHGDERPGPELIDAFRQEARAMARVRHPNVVHIHMFGEHNGVPFFVMEYVPGAALDVHDPAWQSMDGAVYALEQICRGLAAIHAAGAVHNDLKPANVLVGPGYRVVVADFGLATPLTQLGATARLAGTPAYISPEVARGEIVEPSLAPRRDVYALGVMAFELLVGRRPFVTKGWQGLLQEHAYEPPPKATSLRADLPADFDDFFDRALAKQPQARIASVERFRRELLTLQQQFVRGTRPLDVVVAEDDPVAREGIVELLRDEFPAARIRAFAEGESAQRAAQERPPDLVLTDLHMPGRGGLGLTAALRAEPRTQHVPIIVMTGQGGAKDWEVLRHLGADRFLIKPLAFDGLVAAIRALTAG